MTIELEEIWKPIKNYEGLYEVSNLGRIKSFHIFRNISFDKNITERIRKPSLNNSKGRKNFYYRILLNNDGNIKSFYVHRLVAEAFVPNPEGKPQVNHKDGNKLNNTAPNLEWVTPEENAEHAIRNNLWVFPRGENSRRAILKESDVLKIREMLLTKKLLQTDIAKIYNISKVTVSAIKKRRIWNHI